MHPQGNQTHANASLRNLKPHVRSFTHDAYIQGHLNYPTFEEKDISSHRGPSVSEPSQSHAAGQRAQLASADVGVSALLPQLERSRQDYELEQQKHYRAYKEQVKLLEIQQKSKEREIFGPSEGYMHISDRFPATPPGSQPERLRSISMYSTPAEQQCLSHAHQLITPPSEEHTPKGPVSETPIQDFEKLHLEDEAKIMSVPNLLRSRSAEKTWPKLSPEKSEKYLFEDEEPKGRSYLQLNATDDKFPILIRRESRPNVLSAASAALDLAPACQTPTKLSVHDQSFSELYTLQARHADGTIDELAEQRIRYQSSLQPQASPQNSFAGSNRSSPDTRRSDHSMRMDAADYDAPLGETMMSPGQYAREYPNYRVRHPPHIVSPTLRSSQPAQGVFGSFGVYGMSPVFHAGQFGPYPQYSKPESNYGQSPNYNLKQSSYRRNDDSRYDNVMLESLVGQLYILCKDQHGCRFLQKKLSEGDPQQVAIIFEETHRYVVELMTDPFGNYLCQKLLEHCNDEQKTLLVRTAARSLTQISLNMHGTRAVQKMIESLSTPEQIDIIIHALSSHVVQLIQDLNGNHVVQKCLNKLKARDNQFIYDAVANHCVEVASHRHGCCVLQRCIDHASENQKQQLVTEISENAIKLVQDPFGNYVVQYVLDLGEVRFSEPLIKKFQGNAYGLSVQKFSSNVIEKCIRIAEPETRRHLIAELMEPSRLERVLRDSYANYVVQTCLDYADPAQRHDLAEAIRPHLPSIRSAPHGRRIYSKLDPSNGTFATSLLHHAATTGASNKIGDHSQNRNGMYPAFVSHVGSSAFSPRNHVFPAPM
ncbi:Pumilio domain-containing protein isoform B [Neolecta irregularis DAH-3]|uniref:Pumilio domain-containing protein isoform B n=2 Tax=Neolecta irregularis (strain DAH-3) TaxID=1198029 RepID=A0A1U7LPI3_NEOID|nr:Pumilio domain-containing protein isoform B [Neolecta irregularis DAH-3]|eukprot:OLL24452.1 Pumilio domain-containing protein isoform B [Neolecta irregularis DAH-3]